MWDETDPAPKLDLEQACLVVKKVFEHVKEGGSFRHLIYGRLGFGPEAYAPMMAAGALDLSNRCPFPETDKVPTIVSVHITKVKSVDTTNPNHTYISTQAANGEARNYVRWESAKPPEVDKLCLCYYVVTETSGTIHAASLEDENFAWHAWQQED